MIGELNIVVKCATCGKGRNKNRVFNDFGECKSCAKFRERKRQIKETVANMDSLKDLQRERYKIYFR